MIVTKKLLDFVHLIPLIFMILILREENIERFNIYFIIYLITGFFSFFVFIAGNLKSLKKNIYKNDFFEKFYKKSKKLYIFFMIACCLNSSMVLFYLAQNINNNISLVKPLTMLTFNLFIFLELYIKKEILKFDLKKEKNYEWADFGTKCFKRKFDGKK